MSLDQFLAKKKYKEKKIYQSIDNNTRLKLLKIVNKTIKIRLSTMG